MRRSTCTINYTKELPLAQVCTLYTLLCTLPVQSTTPRNHLQHRYVHCTLYYVHYLYNQLHKGTTSSTGINTVHFTMYTTCIINYTKELPLAQVCALYTVLCTLPVQSTTQRNYLQHRHVHCTLYYVNYIQNHIHKGTNSSTGMDTVHFTMYSTCTIKYTKPAMHNPFYKGSTYSTVCTLPVQSSIKRNYLSHRCVHYTLQTVILPVLLSMQSIYVHSISIYVN